jgi:hypothetical protein
MKIGVATGRLGKMRRAMARIFVLSLPFVFLLQLVGQPDFDDRNPFFGARSFGVKVVKQEDFAKNGLTYGQQLSLAVGSRLFTPGFYLVFVRIPHQSNFVRAPFGSVRSSRSPPFTAAS